MSGSVEVSKVHQIHKAQEIQGTVLRIRQLTVRDVEMTQAVVKTDNDLVTCMWRGAKPDALNENGRYTFSGQLRNVDSRRLMVEPGYELATVKARANASASTAAKLKSKAAQKLTKKNVTIAAAIAVIGLGILIPVGLSARHKPQMAIKAAATVATPTPIEKLPPAYDTAGKMIPNTPNDCEIKDVAFNSNDKDDPKMPAGQTKITTAGVNGQDKICYVHGRSQFPVAIHLKEAVNQVRLVGTAKH